MVLRVVGEPPSLYHPGGTAMGAPEPWGQYTLTLPHAVGAASVEPGAHAYPAAQGEGQEAARPEMLLQRPLGHGYCGGDEGKRGRQG